MLFSRRYQFTWPGPQCSGEDILLENLVNKEEQFVTRVYWCVLSSLLNIPTPQYVKIFSLVKDSLLGPDVD
jgi:hypothetical protein